MGETVVKAQVAEHDDAPFVGDKQHGRGLLRAAHTHPQCVADVVLVLFSRGKDCQAVKRHRGVEAQVRGLQGAGA